MMIGASTINANENAMPYAARLYFGSASLAITAAKKGPSRDIINQVGARGSQNRNIFMYEICVMRNFSLYSVIQKVQVNPERRYEGILSFTYQKDRATART